MGVYDMPQNYAEAKEMLKGKSERKIANNTYLHEYKDEIVVRYHSTYIATFYQSRNMIMIDCRGYRSSTTKQRINSILGSRYTVQQKNWEWFVWDRITNDVVPYEDGDEYEAKE